MTRELTIYTPVSYDESGVHPLKEASSFTNKDKAIDCILEEIYDSISDYISPEECEEIIKSLREEDITAFDELNYGIIVSNTLVED